MFSDSKTIATLIQYICNSSIELILGGLEQFDPGVYKFMQYLATTKRAIQKPRVRVRNGPLGWHVSLPPGLAFQGEFIIKRQNFRQTLRAPSQSTVATSCPFLTYFSTKCASNFQSIYLFNTVRNL